MLNDLSRPLRLYAVLCGLALGVIFGSVPGVGSHPVAGFVGVLVGALVYLVATVVLTVTTLRGERDLRGRVARLSPQLVGTAGPAGVPGRVVRDRTAVGLPGFLRSAPAALSPSSVLLVVTVLDGESVRRVAAAAPLRLGQLPAGRPVVVALHPEDAEVAVLDDTVDAGQVEQTRADPRWDRLALPTDSTVRGGWPGLGLALLVGLLLGAGAAALPALLLGA